MNEGILYIALYKPKYVAYAHWSIKQLRNSGCTKPISLITNLPDVTNEFFITENVDVIQISPDDEHNQHTIKSRMYELTPYDTTLFLDSDTIILGDTSPIWEYPGDFCMVASPMHWDWVEKFINNGKAGSEMRLMWGSYQGITCYNSGVIRFSKSEENDVLFKEWNLEWFHFKNTDEPALNRTIADLGKVVTEMDIKYNWLGHQDLTRPKEGEAIIFHPNGMNKLPLYSELFGDEWLNLLEFYRSNINPRSTVQKSIKFP